jgi:hypothetical protein
MTHAAALAVLDAWDSLAGDPDVYFRTGRKVGRTLYASIDPEPSDDDILFGLVDTPEMAAFIACFDPSVVRRITAAMRKLLLHHSEARGRCFSCAVNYPCASVSSIYAALGVTE